MEANYFTILYWFYIHFMASRWKNSGNSGWLFFLAPKSLQMVIAPMKLKDTPWKESYDPPRQHIKKQRHSLSTKVRLVKAMLFPVVMYGCESWTIKKTEHRRIDDIQLWYWRTLESPLACKEIKPVNTKGNQSWIFIERMDAEAETPILWPPDCEELTH